MAENEEVIGAVNSVATIDPDVTEVEVATPEFKITPSDNAPETRKVKEADFDFMLADVLDFFGNGEEAVQYHKRLDEDALLDLVPNMQESLTKGKLALKEKPSAGDWVVGVNPWLFSTLTEDVFGVKETKRILTLNQRLDLTAYNSNAKVKDLLLSHPELEHRFSNRIDWLVWGVIGKYNHWTKIKMDKEHGERSFRGNLDVDVPLNSVSTDKEYQLAMAKAIKQVLYRFTREGDTVLVPNFHHDNSLIKDVALRYGRHVAEYAAYLPEKPVLKEDFPLDDPHSLGAPADAKVKLNSLYHEDVYDFLAKLGDKSVNTLITDVPYNVTQDNGTESKIDSASDNKKAKTHHGPYMHGKTGLDFGDWDRGQFQVSDYIDAVASKITDDGQVIIFNSYANMEEMAWKLKENGLTVMGIYTWEKPNPVPNLPDIFPLNSFEQFIWAVKDPANYTFNIREDSKQRSQIEQGNLIYSHQEDQQHRFHTTQKPISMWEALVEIFSNKGDVVMDNFSGSGVNAISCIGLHRKYVGTELDDTYYEKSVQRIKDFKVKSSGSKRLF